MTAFDTGDTAIPQPSLPGTFKGWLTLWLPVEVTDVKTVSMKGAKGKVKSYKFMDPVTGEECSNLEASKRYYLEVKLTSYPRYFHNTEEIANDYGTLELDSFVDANDHGRTWIPVLRIEGEPAMDAWMPLTDIYSGVCAVGTPLDAGTGTELRNVRIYLDGEDLHKYAPEYIYFCDGCICDPNVSCGFGTHTITLQKANYQDYEEVIHVGASDIIEIVPLMEHTISEEGTLRGGGLSEGNATVRIVLY